MPSQRTAALMSLVCFVLGGIVTLAAFYGPDAQWWSYETGLKVLAPGTALAVLGLAAGGLWLARALIGNDSAWWKLGTLGLLGSLAAAYMPLNQVRLYLISPPIHDVSTDPEYPPPFTALLPLRKGAANGPEYDGGKIIDYDGKRQTVSAVQKKAYPDIKPYYALIAPSGANPAEPKDVLFWRAFLRAQQQGYAIVAYNQRDGVIEATRKSLWFGQVADIAIRVKPAGKIGARADIRAKSRNGDNDMGASAQIVRDYLSAMR
jgi:Protein of unknown function (DUF1499)